MPEREIVQKQHSKRSQVAHSTIPGLLAPKLKRTKRMSSGKFENARKKEATIEETKATKVKTSILYV